MDCSACELLAPPPAVVSRWPGVVRQVSDGDTLWIEAEGQGGGRIKLRLAGIDAPERCQPGGPEARAALAGRVLRQRVWVEPLGHDEHGRVLGRLLLEGPQRVDVGAWLVSAGHAWSYGHRGAPQPYAVEEGAARAAGRGLFSDPAALPPWRFRREQGPCR